MSEKHPPSGEQQKPAELTGREALLHDIGCKLSQSRAASGDSIEEAVRKLKLRKSHLMALENGNWDKMPDDIYVLGFLRQYSQYLHVDLTDEIHRLKNDQYTLTKPLTFPDPPVAPSRRWAWLAGAAFVLLFILFNVATENQRSHHQDAADSAGLETTVEPTLDAAAVLQSQDNSQTAADPLQSNPVQSNPVQTDPIQTNRPDAPATASPSANPAIIATPAPDPPRSETPVAEAAEPAMPATEIIATAASEPTMVQKQAASAPVPAQAVNSTHSFRFDAVGSPVWLQVSRPDQSGLGKGNLLKEVLLQPGFHTTIHVQTASLWITCGNAPALRITVDGNLFAAAGSLGIGKKVLRDYHFSIGDSQ